MHFWNPQVRDTAIIFTTADKTEAMLAAEIDACAEEDRALLVAEEAGQDRCGHLVYVSQGTGLCAFGGTYHRVGAGGSEARRGPRTDERP
ncbi:hypothetical protein ACEWPM_006560 [Roseovarius sp. S4756]|uniref:hypothetical protein n=1 Tax=Roseovarius maritimus TaxID=3342637 RepID=UPI00372734C9